MFFTVVTYGIASEVFVAGEDFQLTYNALTRVMKNIAITEIFFHVAWAAGCYNVTTFNAVRDISGLCMWLVLQDVMQYIAHRAAHQFSPVHDIDHQYVTAFHAWHTHYVEHIALRLLPTFLPLALCTINYVIIWITLVYMICVSCYMCRADDPHYSRRSSHYTALNILERCLCLMY